MSTILGSPISTKELGDIIRRVQSGETSLEQEAAANLSTKFEDDEEGSWQTHRLVPCAHPEHQPPSMILIPEGKKMRHICPGCKQETVVRRPMIRC